MDAGKVVIHEIEREGVWQTPPPRAPPGSDLHFRQFRVWALRGVRTNFHHKTNPPEPRVRSGPDLNFCQQSGTSAYSAYSAVEHRPNLDRFVTNPVTVVEPLASMEVAPVILVCDGLQHASQGSSVIIRVDQDHCTLASAGVGHHDRIETLVTTVMHKPKCFPRSL